MKHKVVKPNTKAWHTSVLLQLKSAYFHSKTSKAANKISLKNTIPYLWVNGLERQAYVPKATANTLEIKIYLAFILQKQSINWFKFLFFELVKLVNGSTVIQLQLADVQLEYERDRFIYF